MVSIATNLSSDPETIDAVHSSTANLPLIRLSAVNPFLMELERRGADGGSILRRLGLPDDIPASSDLFASAVSIYEIVEECAFAADDPHLGFGIGEALDLHQWEPIAKAIEKAETVGDLLRYFVVNALDHSTSTEFFVRTEGEKTTFGLNRVVTPPFKPAQNDAFYLGFFAKVLRQATGEQWEPGRVLAKVAMPEAIPSRRDLPRVAEGSSDGMRIAFPTNWQFSGIRKSGFSSSAANGKAHIPESLVDSVHAALRPHVQEPDLTVDKAARICGYEKRRLGRLLRQQGTTIVKEIAEVRAAKARRALSESTRPVAEIGESVGFRDPTIFSRAFKNWTGHSPRQFRKLQKT